MKISNARPSPIVRFASVLFSSWFLLFLNYSQPHRVHHFFETQSSARGQNRSEGHHGHDHNRSSPQPRCVVLAVSQNCHIGQVETIELSFILSVIEAAAAPSVARMEPITFTSFLQRAPPESAFRS
jgi:hypothetical protein